MTRPLSTRALLLAGAWLLSSAPAPGWAAPVPAEVPEASPEPPAMEPPRMPEWPEPPSEPPAAGPWLLAEPDGSLLDTWLDLPHAFLEKRIFGIVGGFDRFFADERDIGTARSSSFIRVRSEVRILEDGSLTWGNSLRADLSLPYIQKRLKRFRIVLENAGRGLVESEPRAITGQTDGGKADAVLRFTVLDTLRSTIDLGGGVLFALPPGVVGRVRFRYARELGRVALARTLATGFWNTRDGFGSNGSLALERALGTRLLLRWTNGTLISQVSHGWESASELALLAKLGRTTGLTILGSAATRSKPDLVVHTWRVATRLRTSLLRRWIYGEVEPEVTWPLDPVGTRRVVPAVIFRLELQFEEAKSRPGVAVGSVRGLASTDGRPEGGA